MPAYVIAQVDVTDMEQYRKYTQLTPKTIADHDGHFLVRAGEMVTLEGEEETRRIVVLEFPTLEAAKTWFHSDEYQAARALRLNAANATFIAIDGVNE